MRECGLEPLEHSSVAVISLVQWQRLDVRGLKVRLESEVVGDEGMKTDWCPGTTGFDKDRGQKKEEAPDDSMQTAANILAEQRRRPQNFHAINRHFCNA